MPLPVRYLQVVLDISDNDHQGRMFEHYMHELLPTFMEKPWPGWELFLSAQRTPSRVPSTEPDDRDYKSYLHIWRLRDYNSLPYLMEYFDDDEVYRNLNAMVLRETQELTGAMVYNPQNNMPSFRPPEGTRFFLYTEMNMVQSPEVLSEYRTFMIDAANDPSSPLSEAFDWRMVQGTYSQTGRLRRYITIFSTSSPLPQAQEVIDWLFEQPEVQNAVVGGKDGIVWKLYEPISYLNEQ